MGQFAEGPDSLPFPSGLSGVRIRGIAFLGSKRAPKSCSGRRAGRHDRPAPLQGELEALWRGQSPPAFGKNGAHGRSAGARSVLAEVIAAPLGAGSATDWGRAISSRVGAMLRIASIAGRGYESWAWEAVCRTEWSEKLRKVKRPPSHRIWGAASQHLLPKTPRSSKQGQLSQTGRTEVRPAGQLSPAALQSLPETRCDPQPRQPSPGCAGSAPSTSCGDGRSCSRRSADLPLPPSSQSCD